MNDCTIKFGRFVFFSAVFLVLNLSAPRQSAHASATDPGPKNQVLSQTCALSFGMKLSLLERVRYVFLPQDRQASVLLERVKAGRVDWVESLISQLNMLSNETRQLFLRQFVEFILGADNTHRDEILKRLRRLSSPNDLGQIRNASLKEMAYSLKEISRQKGLDKEKSDALLRFLLHLGAYSEVFLEHYAGIVFNAHASPDDKAFASKRLLMLADQFQILLREDNRLSADDVLLISKIVNSLDRSLRFVKSGEETLASSNRLYKLVPPDHLFQRFFAPISAQRLTVQTAQNSVEVIVPVHNPNQWEISTVVVKFNEVFAGLSEIQSAALEKEKILFFFNQETKHGIFISPIGDSHASMTCLIFKEFPEGVFGGIYGTRSSFRDSAYPRTRPSQSLLNSTSESAAQETANFSIRIVQSTADM